MPAKKAVKKVVKKVATKKAVAAVEPYTTPAMIAAKRACAGEFTAFLDDFRVDSHSKTPILLRDILEHRSSGVKSGPDRVEWCLANSAFGPKDFENTVAALGDAINSGHNRLIKLALRLDKDTLKKVIQALR